VRCVVRCQLAKGVTLIWLPEKRISIVFFRLLDRGGRKYRRD
jgi:hypothetical protein